MLKIQKWMQKYYLACQTLEIINFLLIFAIWIYFITTFMRNLIAIWTYNFIRNIQFSTLFILILSTNAITILLILEIHEGTLRIYILDLIFYFCSKFNFKYIYWKIILLYILLIIIILAWIFIHKEFKKFGGILNFWKTIFYYIF